MVVPFGKAALVRGELKSAEGKPIANQSIEVQARLASSGAQLQRIGTVGTDSAGRFTYHAPKGASRTLRFEFAGNAVLLPAETEVRLSVPASTSLKASRRRVRLRQTFRFSGQVGLPVPAVGKLVDLQAFDRGKWRKFATVRAKPSGRWSYRFRFEAKGSRGVRYRFRALVRREAAYAYDTGQSKTISVAVSHR
jgi:hypothetical protein